MATIGSSNESWRHTRALQEILQEGLQEGRQKDSRKDSRRDAGGKLPPSACVCCNAALAPSMRPAPPVSSRWS